MLIKELPVEILKPLEDSSIQEKLEFTFECEFSKENAQSVWTKDNIDVKYALGMDRFSKKVIGKRHYLTIYETKLDDTGKYACTVKEVQTNCNLIVTGMWKYIVI